jgi:peptidyl-prolyl cis-trans isomerase C
VVFKKWMAALLAAVALVACGTPTVQSVARVDNVTLSQQELDARVKRISDGMQAQSQGAPPPSTQDIQQRVVELFITQNLTLNIAKQHGVSVSDQEVDDRINQFRQQIAGSGAGGSFDEVVQQQLGLPGGDSSEFRQFATFVLAQEKLAETLVVSGTATIQQATVAHILIGVPEGADAATDSAAKAKAEQAIERINKGEDFGALAKEMSEDPGSKDNGGVYEKITPGQFVPEFDKAMFQDLKPGEMTQTPVKTQFGYHVIRLISREEVPDEAGLQQARGEALQKLITDERAKAKAEGRLVEPAFPTAVPEPTVEAPPLEQPTAPAEIAPSAPSS